MRTQHGLKMSANVTKVIFIAGMLFWVIIQCTGVFHLTQCGEKHNTEEYTAVYDFNNIFNSGTSVAKQMSTSMKFAFVKHICSPVVLIIHLTWQRKLLLNIFSIQTGLINYTFPSLLSSIVSFNVNLTCSHFCCSEYGTKLSLTGL